MVSVVLLLNSLFICNHYNLYESVYINYCKVDYTATCKDTVFHSWSWKKTISNLEMHQLRRAEYTCKEPKDWTIVLNTKDYYKSETKR